MEQGWSDPLGRSCMTEEEEEGNGKVNAPQGVTLILDSGLEFHLSAMTAPLVVWHVWRLDVKCRMCDGLMAIMGGTCFDEPDGRVSMQLVRRNTGFSGWLGAMNFSNCSGSCFPNSLLLLTYRLTKINSRMRFGV